MLMLCPRNLSLFLERTQQRVERVMNNNNDIETDSETITPDSVVRITYCLPHDHLLPYMVNAFSAILGDTSKVPSPNRALLSSNRFDPSCPSNIPVVSAFGARFFHLACASAFGSQFRRRVQFPHPLLREYCVSRLE